MTQQQLTVYRVFQKKHQQSAWTGEGAERFGGRWNSPGTPVIYTAIHGSLALLEVLAGFGALTEVPENYVIQSATIPDTSVSQFPDELLPENWRNHPGPIEITRYGDAWAHSQQSLALMVPSAVFPYEKNILINPKHSDFDQLQIGQYVFPIDFDSRLI